MLCSYINVSRQMELYRLRTLEITPELQDRSFFHEFLRPDCRFKEEEVLEFEGRSYCRFHLPLISDAKREFDGNPFNDRVFELLENSDDNELACDLSGIRFMSPISFRGVVFGKRVYFDDASFTAVDFSRASFLGGADFSRATFHQASFEEATFKDTRVANSLPALRATKFSGARFIDAFFSRSEFEAMADFQGSMFVRCAFPETRFRSEVNFDKLRCGQADFSGALFEDRANFGGAIFSIGYFDQLRDGKQRDDAVFGDDKLLLSGLEIFRQREMVEPSHFADFTDCRFLQAVRFNECVFARAPRFHGCDMKSSVAFPNIGAFEETGSVEAVMSYRSLKLAMEEKRSPYEQGMFSALEQKSLRHSGHLKRHEWLLSWLYEKTADFGQNALRPMVALCATLFVFALLYSPWQYTTHGSVLGPSFHLGAILGFTLKQLTAPFSIWRSDDVVWESEYHLLLLIMTTLQSVLSTALIALAILAIRWRFRRRS